MDENLFQSARKTRETDVAVSIRVPGQGKAEVSTQVGFLDHMLTLFAVHGMFDLSVAATGDTHVDFHHTVEDVGITLGDALFAAVKDRTGFARYGNAVVPMDEALAEAAVDLSRRPYLVFEVPFVNQAVGGVETQLFREFFRAVVVRAQMTLHLRVPYGKNDHHMIEAVFKAFGRALAAALAPDPRVTGVLSSKGVL
ncbi:MAG: imidazoleglycerol-phosphate dehydratase HisB [Thermodesulfobacteriota bacterium]